MVRFAGPASLWQRFKNWRSHLRGATAAPEEDRRTWGRLPSNQEMTYRPTKGNGQADYSARVCNDSQGGIGLVVDQRLEPGDLLSVELPSADPHARNTVLACVVHVQPEAGGMWALGCSFLGELGDEDLAVLGAERRPSAESDKRNWVRFPCAVKATCQLLAEPASPPWQAEVLDIAATGLGLRVHRAVENGTLLNVDLAGSSGQPAPTLLACVVHVTASNTGDFVLGCNFLRELSDQELRVLV